MSAYEEGKTAFDPTKDPEKECPYNLWHKEKRQQWLEGWKIAKRDADDDDGDDDPRGGGNWPSTSGNPSGTGRGNA